MRLSREFVLHATSAFAAAIAASWATMRFLPLSTDDPLRSTLLVVPWIVVALHLLGVFAPRRLHASGMEIFGTVGLFLAATTRHAFGLAITDWLLVAGWTLLLAAATSRRALAWRPALGREELPSRPSWAFFWLAFVFYVALQPWLAQNRPPDGDEPYYLLVAHSLVHDFDAVLTNNYAEDHSLHFMGRALEPQQGDPRDADGEVYSRHNLLLPLALSPLYALGGKHAVLTGMAALTALLGWMLLRLARHDIWWPDGRPYPGAALLVWALCMFTPPMLLYSYQVWTEVPAALLTCLALDRILMLDGRPPRRRRDLLALALPILFLPILKLRFALVAAPLAFLVWRGASERESSGSQRFRLSLPAAMMLLAVVVGFGGMLIHNQIRYGNALKVYGWHQILHFDAPMNYALGASGFFWDGAFGLFFCAPIWLLILPAFALATRKVWFVLLCLAGPYLFIAAPRTEWYGGWSPPFRYALVFLPLLALTAAPILVQRRRVGVRFLVGPLMLATLVLTLIWTAIPGWTYNFADGRALWLDRVSVVLGADWTRFFPSMIRPRTATWIWPLVTLAAIPLGLWRRRARSAAPAVLGCAMLFGALATIPAMTQSVPTGVVEWEDSWIGREGGRIHPDQWVNNRPLYRGGWVIPPRGRLRAELNPGGEQVVLRFHGQTVRVDAAAPLRVLADDQEIGVVHLDPIGWHEDTIGPIDWPAGATLVVEAAWPKGKAHVILDRTEIEWR